MTDKENNEIESSSNSSCPACGGSHITTRDVEHRFPYGVGPSPTELMAIVPLHECEKESCGVEFFAEELEDRRHEAVCRHLGVLTPKEIREIRGTLSRQEFAHLTRFGEATIGRWERGELIQNAANDLLLRLLKFNDNLSRIKDMNSSIIAT